MRNPWQDRKLQLEPPTQEEFLSGCRSFAGQTNPELIKEPWWEWMVRTGWGPYWARERYKARGAWLKEHPPIWTFNRMGMTTLLLNDHLAISIGGEHEDYYDPDFCIYNDVIIRDFNGGVWIYGYPPDVFPPTDFHTANLAEDESSIYIVGGLGYQRQREPWRTPVYRLELEDMIIRPVQCSGDEPGWIFKHEAVLTPEGMLTVSGGKRWTIEEEIEEDLGIYTLDINKSIWARTG